MYFKPVVPESGSTAHAFWWAVLSGSLLHLVHKLGACAILLYFEVTYMHTQIHIPGCVLPYKYRKLLRMLFELKSCASTMGEGHWLWHWLWLWLWLPATRREQRIGVQLITHYNIAFFKSGAQHILI